MAALQSTFFIATTSENDKVIIHRITESPSKAIKYRTDKLNEGLENVMILRKTAAGDYVDITEGVLDRGREQAHT